MFIFANFKNQDFRDDNNFYEICMNKMLLPKLDFLER